MNKNQFEGWEPVSHKEYRKSPVAAVLLCLVLPGLSSMGVGESRKGASLLALYAVSWLIGLFVPVFFIVSVVVMGFSMREGYKDTVMWNKMHGV